VATKAVAKPSVPSTAKPVAKAAVARTPELKAAAPAAKPAKVAAKPVVKAAPPAKVVAKAPAAKAVAVPAAKSATKASPKPAAVEAAAPAKATKAKAPTEAAITPELFQGGFFFEVAVGSAAVRKVKTSIVQSAPVSKKAAKDEETHDELLARIERDLHKARMTVRKVTRSMVCTKCCIMPVDEAFIVDRDTAYCTECALMLGLGHTREARHQNFHPSLMKSGEEEEDI
jgi:hypothetical protein